MNGRWLEQHHHKQFYHLVSRKLYFSTFKLIFIKYFRCVITADLFHAIFPDIFARGFHLLIATLSYIIYFIYECVETADYFRELEDANGKTLFHVIKICSSLFSSCINERSSKNVPNTNNCFGVRCSQCCSSVSGNVLHVSKTNEPGGRWGSSGKLIRADEKAMKILWRYSD